MKPDFSKIDFTQTEQPALSHAEQTANWKTPEGFVVPSPTELRTLALAPHTRFGAGTPPYLRGPYSTMYVQQPWTIRQYAGFSTAEASTLVWLADT